MNSNNMVNQGAVVLLCSAEQATHLQIPQDQWVFPYAGTDSHDTYSITERGDLHRSPAIPDRRAPGPRTRRHRRRRSRPRRPVFVLPVRGAGSPPPSWGWPHDDPQRPLTVTGGLTFAGGPWNNYVMHSIATMTGLLRADPSAAA